MSPTPASQSLFERATRVIPGGVNSPVRAFGAVGGDPLFIASGDGAHVTDADGKRYIDYVGSWGPMVLGHRPAVVIEALRAVLDRGTSFGAPTDLEVEMAELLTQVVPSMEMVRMVNSGTEACMTALRLARGATGRDVIIKFNGCYHGHSDSLLVAAGSGVATFGISGSPGVPDDIARRTVSIEYNDLDLLRKTVDCIGADQVAAIMANGVGSLSSSTPFEIISVVRNSDTEVEITWNSKPGITYAVDRSTGQGTFNWGEVDDGTIGAGETASYTDSNIPAGSKDVFHRVRVVE